ncbi:MAG: leucine-rich repeat protein [Bacteroidales bacterium]|nr:leucine-rich repeat protein [Bacteroidales bacterium]
MTAIGEVAFSSCSGLTSVTIPESVTYIGYDAFLGCSGLTSVTIPNRVTYIGDYVFEGCSGLTSVTIPESVDTIGDYAFYGTSISGPLYNSKVFAYMPTDYSGEYEIPAGIQSIAGGAFAECSGLSSVMIPESVTSIGSMAFYGCSGLTSVNIPESVDIIGFSAFSGTSISTPLYNSKVFVYMPKTYRGEYAIPDGIQSIAPSAFEGCRSLTSVTIPNSVTSIRDYAFSYFTGLTSVTIPESVTYIGEYAFQDCSNLTSVTIPESVTTIRRGVFVRTGLTSVTIPNSVTSIGDFAFLHCTGLTSVISLTEEPPYCGSEVFSDYSAQLLVPRGCKAAYQTAKKWSEFTSIYEFGIDGTGLVTVQPNNTDMGYVTGGGEYEIDEKITLEAIPNPGYHFVKWDDGKTSNPRRLNVTHDITLMAIFAKGTPTANENPEADNFRVYVQDRTIYLSEYRGLVQVYNMAGQCVYNGHATAIPVQQSGVYILVANDKRIKVAVK